MSRTGCLRRRSLFCSASAASGVCLGAPIPLLAECPLHSQPNAELGVCTVSPTISCLHAHLWPRLISHALQAPETCSCAAVLTSARVIRRTESPGYCASHTAPPLQRCSRPLSLCLGQCPLKLSNLLSPGIPRTCVMTVGPARTPASVVRVDAAVLLALHRPHGCASWSDEYTDTARIWLAIAQLPYMSFHARQSAPGMHQTATIRRTTSQRPCIAE